MGNNNSILPFVRADNKDLQDTVGLTQFSGATSTEWQQTIGGVLFQGGLVIGAAPAANTVVTFPGGFPLQVLGIFLQGIDAIPPIFGSALVSNTLADFTFYNSDPALAKDFYWFAIGV